MKPGKLEVARTEYFEGAFVRVQEVLSYLQQDWYMTRKQAAAYTTLDERTLDSAKDLPRYKPVPGRTLFRKTEIDRWMEQHRVNDNDLQSTVIKVLSDLKHRTKGV